MDHLNFHHDRSLDYISDLDFNRDPTVPSIASNQDPFDSFSSPFPATPSYNGSYQNSPYSGASDLVDFDHHNKDALGLFDNDPLVVSRDEYDPAAYDAPSGGGLLMFDTDFMSNIDGANVSLSVTPADDHSPAHSPALYDHGSPASSAGRADSPASSISSHPHSGGSHNTHNSNTQTASNIASPRINFTALHVDSPYHPNAQLPASPPNKPQSPPQLFIPEGQEQAPPMINAPEGDGGVGPRLHIVPATPVSGGNATQAHNAFGQGAQQNASSSWSHDPSGSSGPAQSSSYNPSFTFPPNPSERSALNLNTGSGLASSADDFLLPPSPSRSRSKSDTSPRPSWLNSSGIGSLLGPNQGSAVDMAERPSFALEDVMHQPEHHRHTSSASALQTSFSGGPGSGGLGGGFPAGPNGLLSPDFGTSLRRVRSMGHRQARSEDFSQGSAGLGGFPPSQHQDFIRQTQTQYLQPVEAVPNLARSAPGVQGHHRRASSGSRERRDWAGGSHPHSARASPYPSPSASPARMVEPLPNVGMGGGMGMGVGMGMGRHHLVQDALPVPGMHAHHLSAAASRAGTPAHVPKPNVTTTATADASMKRRINDAKFVCPVPGCGSTFTRHFNLKGHMRSHNDEKPFQCKWPGCGKGFARQHDCKRHEQLHSNHRPFTCEGCKKPFARLDALNRHLRSEGGAGCAKMQDAVGGDLQMDADMQQQPELSLPQAPQTKMEPDAGGWGNSGFAGLVM